jgi:SRSO17 transposase
LDRRLYLPKEWFDQAPGPLRQRCGVPEDLPFQTEPALALEMVCGLAVGGEGPFRWVVADEPFGSNPAFLDGVAALEKCYLVAVPLSTKMWVKEPKVEPPGPGPMGRPRQQPRLAEGEPRAEEVSQIAAHLPAGAWKPYLLQEGSKGPIGAEFAFLRATRARRGRPGARVWVVLRRSTEPHAEMKVYLSNAPATCARNELVRVRGLRWPIERALEEGKGELGMDH